MLSKSVATRSISSYTLRNTWALTSQFPGKAKGRIRLIWRLCPASLNQVLEIIMVEPHFLKTKGARCINYLKFRGKAYRVMVQAVPGKDKELNPLPEVKKALCRESSIQRGNSKDGWGASNRPGEWVPGSFNIEKVPCSNKHMKFLDG